jgi:lysozyme
MDPQIPEELEDNLLRQLNGEEGRKPCVYQDHLGFWTIGVGRLVDERKGGGLSTSEMDYLLGNDIIKVYAQVLGRFPWAAQLPAPRLAVLCQMAFQMGIGGLAGFVNTLRMIQSGAYGPAADAMLQSTWAKQTPERAAREAGQMRTGKWIFKPGT